MESHGKSWKVMESHGKSWKVMESHGKSWLTTFKRDRDGAPGYMGWRHERNHHPARLARRVWGSWAGVDVQCKRMATVIHRTFGATPTTRRMSTDCRAPLVEGLRAQALIAIGQARWSESRRVLDEGLALVRARPSPYMEAKLLYIYGLVEQQAKQPKQALAGCPDSSSESDSGGPSKEKSHTPLSAAGATVL